ncbi:MAG TPA: hypothetical protein VM680_18430 [Verrucomicrobiae bacterium]|nr:hypothetical protein [Verrucomicrobiae bacterium]
MNPGQLQKHWRLWAAACKAQGWKSSDDQKRYAAYTAAMSACKAAGHVVPPLGGSGYSSKQFATQPQIDALFDHLTQLATNNGSLKAAIRQANPDEGDKKRLIWAITHRHDEAFWRHIAVDKFGSDRLEDLSISQLVQLRNTCDARAAARKRKRLEPYNRATEKRAHVVPASAEAVFTQDHAAGSDAESDDALECGETAPLSLSTATTADHIPF